MPKLFPRFIGPFTVIAKKVLAYTLNFPRKLRTHPVFYVGLLEPYRDPSNVSLEALAPRRLSLPSAVASESGGQADPSSGLGSSPMPGHGLDPTTMPASRLALRRTHSGSYLMYQGDHSALKAPSHAPPSVHRQPPPTLLDEKGNHQFHVERLLKRRHRHGQ